MGQLIISEQDIVNAICIYLSRQKHLEPDAVEVELIYDDEQGFSAEADINGQREDLETIHIIKALRIWLDEFLNEDPFAGIELVLDDNEGIIALINK